MNQTFALLLSIAHTTISFTTRFTSQLQPVDPYTMTTDRLWATASAVLALAATVIGGLAVARSVRQIGPGQGRNGAIVALIVGLLAAIIGGLLLATADGGPGTGNGVVGAFAALVLGLIAIAEGGLVLARSRRMG